MTKMTLSLNNKLPRQLLADWRATLRKCTAPVLLMMLLNGCVSYASPGGKDSHAVKLPDKQLTDFLLISCDDLWQLPGKTSDDNPLYWLRAMECSQRMTPQQALILAAGLPSDNWQDNLRRAILYARLNLTADQQQHNIDAINALAAHIPPQIGSVFQLWRDNQQAQQTLMQERNRYQKLQQHKDNEIDTLRQQLQNSQNQLNQTTRKLESLTDIERQLSSRKTTETFIPPGGHAAPATEATASDKAASAKTDSKTAKKTSKKADNAANNTTNNTINHQTDNTAGQQPSASTANKPTASDNPVAHKEKTP